VQSAPQLDILVLYIDIRPGKHKFVTNNEADDTYIVKFGSCVITIINIIVTLMILVQKTLQ
jgi:hypothetical protein